MREQKAYHPGTYVIQKRASLPPAYQQEVPPASRHRTGHHPGMHPEDMPYTTRTRYRVPPQYDTEYSTEDDEEYRYPHHTRSSVIVRQQPYTYVEPVTTTGEREQQHQPYRGKHPVFYLGVSLLIVFGFITAYILIPPAMQRWSDDRVYGYPRTYQTDANVGHDGTSHFLVMNVHGTIEVIEILPDPRKNPPHLYLIAQFADHGADLVPATISFSDLNGDGKPDMQVTVYNGTNPTIYVLFNDGTQFVPKL